MTIKLYNTLTRKREELRPGGQKIGMYVCGPTVYDYFHIGNARVFIVFDFIRRYLEYRGYEVVFVQNFTDIEDKMIRRAQEMGVSVPDLASRFIDAYFEDAKALGVRRANHHPRATEHIDQIIELIQRLFERGLAYNLDGDVYYDTSRFPGYGKLSHQRLEDLEAGARIEVDERKRHAMDFALWKKQKPGEPAWDSPWGRGRPGWHIECSAMAMHYLGDTIDIHGGGPDLIFPHHENEIAQSEGATGKPFAKYWMHVGYLNIDQEKMSKSKGNFLTVRELCKVYDPKALRYFMLSAHYRNPINFSTFQVEQALSALERLNTLLYNIKERLPKVSDSPYSEEDKQLISEVERARQEFTGALDDDFNTAGALAVLFDLARAVNIYLNSVFPQNSRVLETVLKFYREADNLFSFLSWEAPDALDKEIEELIARRQQARRKKDWATADSIRDQLLERGIILEDTPQGVRWRYR